ncbi:Seipin [Operophtera brumata]|uniref:Seipin n=1 Tax=Operophtera brumata TaxID=104452 RepID=A0A0L7L9W8_OPEBR|nr:Seipin [Operophtera brumata]
MSLISYLSPFRIYREFFFKPVQSFAYDQYKGYKKKTGAGINSVKELVYRAGIVAVFLSAILWISIFMYVIFYYTYMPNVTHVRPVHLQFKSCEEHMGICSFPSAHVQLTRRSHMLMASQPYRNLPVTDAYVELQSRFAQVYACELHIQAHFTGLRYVMFHWPNISALIDAYVELQSRFAQVYACELHIQAHFTGLRYVMFHWPNISALIDAYVELQSQVYACELHIQAHFTGLRYVMFHWPNISALIGKRSHMAQGAII